MRSFLRSLSPRQLLLIDGIGALVTASLLLLLLAPLAPVFGMPRPVLYGLGGVALLFAAYSLGGHFLVKRHPGRWLLGIAVANTLYCLCTLGLMWWHREGLSWLGVAYFLGEIAIVLSLVAVEVGAVRRG